MDSIIERRQTPRGAKAAPSSSQMQIGKVALR
jgi:hypothetical protein